MKTNDAAGALTHQDLSGLCVNRLNATAATSQLNEPTSNNHSVLAFRSSVAPLSFSMFLYIIMFPTTVLVVVNIALNNVYQLRINLTWVVLSVNSILIFLQIISQLPTSNGLSLTQQVAFTQDTIFYPLASNEKCRHKVCASDYKTKFCEIEHNEIRLLLQM